MPASEILLTIQSDTKEEEREIIIQFLSRLQYSKYTLNDFECPDFDMKLNNRDIGVEVTKYYTDFGKKGSAKQKKISEWKKFSEELKANLGRINSQNDFVYGAIHFCVNSVRHRELLNNAPFNELVSLIENNRPDKNESKNVIISKEIYPIIGKYIGSVYLLNTFPETKYLWWDSSLQSGEVVNNRNAVRLIIEKKERASKKYKRDYFQKWLIIYAGGLGLHDMYLGTSERVYRQGKIGVIEESDSVQLYQDAYKSEYFSHIFIWDKYSETIFLLSPYFKKIFDYGKKEIYVNHLPLKD
ncbi:MAG: hypothetical protein P4L51_18350 [Puia sp.]|nr:hypothetical protein [Puia sp.]